MRLASSGNPNRELASERSSGEGSGISLLENQPGEVREKRDAI
jgi:hypothetical protein